MAPACGLIEGVSAGQVIADRAYDAHQLHVLSLTSRAASRSFHPAVIADTSTPTTKIAYKNRWGIEGFFAKLK